jgi:hypothetical protein
MDFAQISLGHFPYVYGAFNTMVRSLVLEDSKNDFAVLDGMLDTKLVEPFGHHQIQIKTYLDS